MSAGDVIEGDCLDVMRGMPDASVDAVITDPPAGIGFMGKAWDGDKGGRKQWVAWLTEVMAECLRVLKPGGHALVWALPRTSHWTATAIEDAGFEIRDVIMHIFGSGFPKSKNLDGEWEGWGTALKPAAEHWILARKPLGEKTVAANVLKHGTGAINIDGCRVPGALEGDPNRFAKTEGGDFVIRFNKAPTVRSEGRWPANVTLDEEAAEVLDSQSGISKSGTAVRHNSGGKTFGGENQKPPMADLGHNDSGGASRFFYVAKPSTKERNAGLESNSHPTVKPIALMRYLCRLITPPNGIILDPFTGSGTTGCAAVLEGFAFVGIEADTEHVATAEARIAHWATTIQDAAAQPRLEMPA